MAETEAEKTESEAEETAEGAEEEQKKGPSKVILIIGAMLILLVIGGAVAFFTGALDGLLGKDGAQAEESHETESHGADTHGSGDPHGAGGDSHGKKADSHGGGHGKDDGHGGGHGVPGGPLFMEIPDLIVNLSSTGTQPRFLKLKVQIEVENASDLAKVEAVAPRVIDHFQTYLRELRVDDLKGSAGIYRLRQELVRRVNAAAYPVTVEDVLFQEILIQ